MHLVVDAMNVIGSRPDGWWRDRDGAKRRLVERLARYARANSDTVTVVFDGRPLPDLSEGEHEGVEVLYAAHGGRDAADDRIVELVRDATHPEALLIVTSDRELRRRVRVFDASVRGAGELVAELNALEVQND